MYNLQTVSAIATIRVYVICYVNVEYKKNYPSSRKRVRARAREDERREKRTLPLLNLLYVTKI